MTKPLPHRRHVRIARTALTVGMAIALIAAPSAALAAGSSSQATTPADAQSGAPGHTSQTSQISHNQLSVYADQLVTFEYPSTWELETHRDNGVEHRVFSNEDVRVQVATISNDYASDAPDFVEAHMEALVGEFDLDDAVLGEWTYRSVDGVPISDVPYTLTEDGSGLCGIVTMVGGRDYSSMVISTFAADAPVETIASVHLLHESISPVEGTSGGFVSVGYGPEATLNAGTMKTREAGAASFVIDGIRYTVLTGTTSKGTDRSADGETTRMITVSMGVSNISDKPIEPSPLHVLVTGPSGIVQDVSDSIGQLASDGIAPGEEFVTTLALDYDGTGVYYVSICPADVPDEEAVILTMEI